MCLDEKEEKNTEMEVKREDLEKYGLEWEMFEFDQIRSGIDCNRLERI